MSGLHGWVPVRRGIKEHREDVPDAAWHIFIGLLLEADYQTGVVRRKSAKWLRRYVGMGVTDKVVWDGMAWLFAAGWLEDLRSSRNQKYTVRIVKWFHEDAPDGLKPSSNLTGSTEVGQRSDNGSTEVEQHNKVTTASSISCGENRKSKVVQKLRKGRTKVGRSLEQSLIGREERREKRESHDMEDEMNRARFGKSAQKKTLAAMAKAQETIRGKVTSPNQATYPPAEEVKSVPANTPKEAESTRPAAIEKVATVETPVVPGSESFAQMVIRLLPDKPCYSDPRWREESIRKAEEVLGPYNSDLKFRAAVEWILAESDSQWNEDLRFQNTRFPHSKIVALRATLIETHQEYLHKKKRTEKPAKKEYRRIPFGNPLTLAQMREMAKG